MDCLANIGGAILGPVFSYMFAPAGENLCSYKDKIKNLENQVQKLDDKICMIQSVTEQAKNVGNAIMGHVQDWQKDATTKSKEAEHFLKPDPDHTRARCSCRRPLPNLALRWRLSKKAKEMAEEIERLIRKADDFGNNISFRPAVQLSFEQEDFEKFETRKETLREMMKALRNPEVRMIGLCGLGGMGKTMLVKEVARLAKEEDLFNKQILAVVSQNPDFKQIQQVIADQLGLEFKEDAEITRAERLAVKLKQEKILIVLDDVWTELDLSKVGICSKDDSKECKIILTSRSREVCQAMGADEKTTFKIESLTDVEAANFFNKIVGDIKPELESLATEVIGECGGLPLAIVITASALKINQSCSFWSDALVRLKRLPTESEIHRRIYECFKTSFDALGNEAKSLLLICSAHDEDENVSLEELTGYVLVLDLFGCVYTLKEASNRVESLVNNLKAYSLLSDGNYRRTIKVHDVIRDVAISIASELEKNPMYCLRESVRLEDFLNRENFKELYAISVPGDGGGINDQLPERLACPRLKLLMLRTIGGLEITDRFFEETKELKALRLDFLGGKKLASPFRSLQNLKALHLRIWKVKFCREEAVDIAIIGELTNLLILDLSDSQGLVVLPKEIGNLSRLQLLNLNDCEQLEVIEPNVISRLVQLEELYMEGVWNLKWETEGEINASLTSEIKDLRKLRVLHIWMPVLLVPEDMFDHLKLERYDFLIGHYYRRVSRSRSTRVLWVKQLEDTSLLYEDGFQMFMKKSDELRLKSIPGVGHIVNELDASSFQDLECLVLKKLENLKSFMPTSPPTRSIERRTLFNDKVATIMSFRNLQELTISQCNNVQCMFSFTMVESLIQLKELKVSRCKAMEQIVTKAVGEDGRVKNIISFPKLESLELDNLPKLKRFCEGDCSEFPSLLKLEIRYCYELMTFIPNSHESTIPTLQAVDEERELEAQQPLFNEKVATRMSFRNLQKLTISVCNNVQCLFSFAMVESLIKLKELSVSTCEAMEQIVTKAVGEDGRLMNSISFPKLESLDLCFLYNLKRFCEGDCIEFHSLLKLRIIHCYELRTFIPNSHKSTIPTLQAGDEERELEAQQPLFNEKVATSMSFRNLQELTISVCYNVQCLFSFAMVKSLIKLKELKVSTCEAMEQIVTKAVGEDGRLMNIISFPKLESLDLYRLPKLKRFCEGDCIEFHSLLKLIIRDCYELRTFIPNSHKSTIPTLQAVDEERELEAQQPLFNEKVVATNLTNLQMRKCHGLISLFNSSTATSLARLTSVLISECSQMTQVIHVNDQMEDESAAENEIVFSQLKILVLHCLPNLKCFHSGNNKLQFPNLKKIILSESPEMRSFSHGTTTTPNLNKLIIVGLRLRLYDFDENFKTLEEEAEPIEELWEGDLNGSIRKLWDDSYIALQWIFSETVILNN